MSGEQGKFFELAKQVWREGWAAYERSFEQYDVPNSGPVEWDARDALADKAAFSVLAAALAQARREGVEENLLMARWIAREARLAPRIDHACAECIPGGPMVQNGFRCAVHIAARLLAKEEGR